jgi:hypothetical protein
MRPALLFVFVAMVPACDRSSRTAPPSHSPAVATLLAHLPATTDAIVAGSLAELANWPLWRRAVGVIAHEAPGIGERFVAQCKLDPWTVLSTAALAFNDDIEGTVLAAETTIDRAQLHECLTSVASDVALAVEDGPLTQYRHAGAVEHAAWTSERVVLAIPQRMADSGALKELLPERAVSAALAPLLQRVDRGATVWGVATTAGDGAISELVATIPLAQKPIGLHASLHRSNGLRVAAALVFADAKGASEAKALFDKLLAQPPAWLATWRDAIRVEAKGDEMRLELRLDATRAKQLDDTIIALLPAPTAPPRPLPAAPEVPSPPPSQLAEPELPPAP